jgi:hypothetical protein
MRNDAEKNLRCLIYSAVRQKIAPLESCNTEYTGESKLDDGHPII